VVVYYWRIDGADSEPRRPRSRRDAFLDAAQSLIQSKGYEQMSIQDVVDRAGRVQGCLLPLLRLERGSACGGRGSHGRRCHGAAVPVTMDPDIPALEKLTRLLASIAQWKGERSDLMIELVRVWFSDANTVVRDQLRIGVQSKLTPLLATIVRQGKAEGVFTASLPEHTQAFSWRSCWVRTRRRAASSSPARPARSAWLTSSARSPRTPRPTSGSSDFHQGRGRVSTPKRCTSGSADARLS